MKKQILNDSEIKEPLLKGMSQIAAIVKRTLGPGGRPIIIERLGQAVDGTPLGPKITKDGVSVAMECSSPDPVVDVVIQTVKNICKKTNSDAGDGTTTAIVLGEAILEEILKYIKRNPESNPQLVKESLELALNTVKQRLDEISTPIKSGSEISHVATISANGDLEIGNVIKEAFEHVGNEGVVTVDEGAGAGITLTKVDGYQFNKGAVLRDAFFNSKQGTHFEAEDDSGVALIIYDGKIISYTQIIPALEILAGARIEETSEGPKQVATRQIPPLVIVANEFSPEVMQFLLIQKHERGLRVCCVEGPHVTHVRTGYYDDLAAYSGGYRLGSGHRNLDAIEEDDIGLVRKIVVDKYKTTLYDGFGSEETILERVNQLRALRDVAESPYDKQLLNDRIAALTSGIAKIGVGGVTELEIKEKYDRIEDALNAARAAIQQGVVPGGGTTLYRISLELENGTTPGEEILSKALKAPINQILENIGLNKTTKTEILHELKISNQNTVYDARNKEFTNAIDSGIIDPVKVTKSALENAISIAGLLSTSGGAIIYNKNQVFTDSQE